MKNKIDELYEERKKISYEIRRLKRLQQMCNHTFTPLINEPEVKDGKLINKYYRRCVLCGKVEFSYSLDEPKYISEYTYKRKK